MENENKLSNADPSDPLKRLLGGEENVSKDANLDNNNNANPPKADEALEIAKLKEITGRDYKSKDDVLKHFSELNKFVGDKTIADLRVKAEEYDKLIKNSNVETQKDVNKSNESSQIESLRARLDESDLLKAYPESEKVLPTIKKIAKAEGITYKEAYEKDLMEIYQAKLASDKAKDEEQNISLNSKQRMTSAKSGKVSDLAQKVLKNPRSDEAKEALVREVLVSEDR